MKLFFLSVMVLIFSAHNGIAQAWVFVSTAGNNEKVYIFSKPIEVNKEKKIVSAWIKVTHPVYTLRNGDSTYTNVYSKQLYTFLCEEGKAVSTEFLLFDQYNKIITSNKLPAAYSIPPPESIGRMVLDKACYLFLK